jgi:uncharacterized protein YndB with AHSA1/START domain
MLKYEKSFVINAPLEEVFTYTADPVHLPDYWVGVDAVKDIQRLPNGGYRFTSIVKMFGQPMESTTEEPEFVPNDHITAKVRSPFMDFTFTAFFERVAGNKTRLSSVFEYTFPPETEAKIGAAFLAVYLDHELDLIAANLKACIEARIPAGAIR